MTQEDNILSFESFGARIAIRMPDAKGVPEFHPELPPMARPLSRSTGVDTTYTVTARARSAAEGGFEYELWHEGELKMRSSRLPSIGRELASDVHYQVSVFARDWVFVHAGVVAIDGKAVVIPGRSMAGKSSLVLELVAAGAEYYSDEFAVLDAEGRVHPYLKSLSQRTPSGFPNLHSPPSLGVQGSVGPVPMGSVLLTSYHQDAVWNPVECPKSEGVLGLFDNTVLARTQPELSLATLSKAIEGARVYRGVRGEAALVAEFLMQQKAPPAVGREGPS